MTFKVRPDVDLRPLNTFGVPARAREYAELRDESDLDEARAWLDGRAPLLLGGGSNLLLVADPPMPVLRLALPGLRLRGDSSQLAEGDAPLREDEVLLEAAAGESWHGLVQRSIDSGLAGLENLALIPGTCGAAPIQNIGAYGVELTDRLVAVRTWDPATGRIRTLDRADCGFGYRTSVFKREARGLVVLSMTLRLQRCDADGFVPASRLRLDYGDLRAEVEALVAARGLPRARPRDVMDAVVAIRRRKLPDPAVLGNAGSFFQNPVVPAVQAEALAREHAGLPVHPAGHAADGTPLAKIPAGWLIDRAGWKGARRGDAGVHDRHALVLVNHGSATGADIAALAGEIRADVRARFGVALEPEPNFIG